MTFVLLASGDLIVEQLEFETVTPWELDIERDVVIPEGAWFSTGQIQLQLQVFFSVSLNGELLKRGTERYLNPTQRQIGYYSLLADGFVTHDSRLQYEQQLYQQTFPTIQIAKTLVDARINLASTTKSGVSHVQTISPITICGTTTSFNVPSPAPSPGNFSAEIGDGGFCGRVLPGSIDLQELQPYTSAPKVLNISGQGLLIPDLIAGVVYGGYTLEVGYLLGYHGIVSPAVSRPADTFLPKNAPFVPVTYTCPPGGGPPAPFTPLPCPISGSSVIYSIDALGRVTQFIACDVPVN